VRVSLDALPVLKTATLIFDARDVNLLHAVSAAAVGGTRSAGAAEHRRGVAAAGSADCAFAVGPRLGGEGRRLVAAIDRSWLEFVVGACERRGIAVQGAWPAQLTLPVGPDRTALACLNDGLALRTGMLDGIGWGASPENDFRIEAIMALLASAGTPSAPPARRPRMPNRSRRRCATGRRDGSTRVAVRNRRASGGVGWRSTSRTRAGRRPC
jgi:hypothetical protein